mmetsp:Transcript_7430/g.14621  ORF Transcript_7430/g.14621 Transcript_7430/m.14621 type:complete len:550 (-) Transcript_7430:346-1995(-)
MLRRQVCRFTLSRSLFNFDVAISRTLVNSSNTLIQSYKNGSSQNTNDWRSILAASGLFIFGSTMGTAFAEENHKPSLESQALTNNPMEYDPITNEHTAKMTMARSSALEYYQSGKYDKAESKFIEALEEAKLGFDAKDPHIASCKNNLAEFYRNTGQYNKAETFYLEALDQLELIYGEKHWLFVSAMHNLALMYESRGDLKSARAYMDRVLKLRRSMFGPRHFLYADSMFGMAHILKKTGGKDKEAIQLMRDAIKILEEEESVQTSVVVAWLMELTAEHRQMKKLPDAVACLRKALFHLSNEKGEGMANASQISDDLYDLLIVMKKKEDAREVLKACFEARKEIFGSQLIVAQTANRLAQLEVEMKRPEDAAQYYATSAVVSRAVLAECKSSTGWLQGLMGSGISNTAQRQLQATNILATCLKATAEIMAAAPGPKRNLAAAEAALTEAVDVAGTALVTASQVVKAAQSGRPLPEGLDPTELSALIVEVQLLTIECLEQLQGIITIIGGADVDGRVAAIDARVEELSQRILAVAKTSVAAPEAAPSQGK